MLKTKVTRRTANRVSKFNKRAKRIIKKPRPLKEYVDHGYWHGKKPITVKGRTLSFAGTITGCGLGQVHGVINLGSDMTKAELLEAFRGVKEDGVGAVMCTLGYDHYRHEKTLIELGFEKVAEYSNYRHGKDGRYKQRMYLLKL